MSARQWVVLVVACVLPLVIGCSGTNGVGPPPAPGLEFVFDRVLGATGSGDGEFVAPSGIGADAAGALYVADTGNHRIQKLDADGAFAFAIGGEGSEAGRFRSPAAVAVSGSSVYVADTGNLRLQVFTADGGFVREFGSRWPEGGSLREPRALVVGTSAVAVADGQQHRVVVYDMDGNVVRTLGALGNGDGEFLALRGLALLGSTLYAVDADRGDIQAFDLGTGGFLKTLGRMGSDLGELRSPTALAADGSGLWVLDNGNARVQLLATSGATQAVVRPARTAAGSLVTPSGIAAWRGGFVVADTGQDRLVSFKPKPDS
ncbi:MAG: 6-bladed beta-propeller [Armatimonadetes bacterium]|nr:6-bladed beta-propeller [Armatimonadota bacterium]